jgi:uncharacterized repeat protein (TIGR01451 family)
MYVSSSSNFPGGVTASLTTLPVGASAVFKLTVSPTNTGNLTDTAQVTLGPSSFETDPVLFNNSASYAVTVGPAANLGVSAKVSPATVVAGYNATYVAVVSNGGPSSASGVVFSQTIPAGASLPANFSSQPGVVVTNGNITWSIGNLANGASLSITNVVTTPKITSGGSPISLFSTFSVFGQPGEATTANSSVTLSNLAEVPTITIVPVSASLVSQSGSSPNGAINPEETVGLDFYLQNTGNVSTTNLVAVLQANGGVTPSIGTNNYGALAPGAAASAGANTFTFTASGTNGGTVVATLSLQDGSANLGTVSFSFSLPEVQTFWNTSPIYIPAQNLTPQPDSGPASPYPSSIVVSNVSGFVSKVTVTVSNLSHTYPHDIGFLLVGPTGSTILMDGAANYSTELTDATLTFDSTAEAVLPSIGSLSSGTYKPASYIPGDVFTNAVASLGGTNAVGTNYSASLTGFAGLPANGVWSLYAHDNAEGDAGTNLFGWAVTFTTITPVNSINPLAPPTLYAASLAGGSLQLTLVGEEGQTYTIQTSSNLLNWTPVFTNTAAASNSSFIYLDTHSNAPLRFYRAVHPPQ